MTGNLYLIPVPISTGDIAWIQPAAVQQCVGKISHFIVEHPKTARQFLKQIGSKFSLQDIKMWTLNKHTSDSDLYGLLEPLLAGHDMGLLSEAGCPAVADPGSGLIRLAHKNAISVIPLVGPSSILLALMASGLNGQRFVFHGYLPIENSARARKIAELEKVSINQDQTQIFIETPYRNQKLLEQLVTICSDNADLCIASNLTSSDEKIATKSIKQWRYALPDINKLPTIFLLHG
ncbi:MAG: SAM-dependent methyltransferase [Nitrosomonas sp.]|nr:MAG: SAM-dependent methyltransferase [Nitrosomonas sp.]